MAKATTLGNAPTNTTYWMKLVEQYDSPSNLLMTDGPDYYRVDSITKSAGDNQDVIITQTPQAISSASLWAGLAGKRLYDYYQAHIGNPNIYYQDGGVDIHVIIDTVAYDSVNNTETVTLTCHLATDFSEAISLTNKNLYIGSYIDSTSVNNLLMGDSAAINGTGSAMGDKASVKGTDSHAEGSGIVNADRAHAEGIGSFAEGQGSHAEGTDSYASAYSAHAEGYATLAMGAYSHAEGNKTWTRGAGAHAEGRETQATGDYSHASGYGTTANRDYMTAVGKFNSDYNVSGKTPLFSVGNGTDAESKSNALTVYEDGYISIGSGHNRFKITKVNGVWGYYNNDNNVFHPFGDPVYLDQQVTLSTSADTTVTYTNTAIKTTSMIIPFTDDYTIVPKNVVASNGSCTVTFGKVSTAVTIGVRIEVKNV